MLRWYSDLGLLSKLLLPWTGAIVVTFIAVTVSIYSTPDDFGLNDAAEAGAAVMGFVVWAVGLAVLSFIAFVVEWLRRRPEPRPRQFLERRHDL